MFKRTYSSFGLSAPYWCFVMHNPSWEYSGKRRVQPHYFSSLNTVPHKQNAYETALKDLHWYIPNCRRLLSRDNCVKWKPGCLKYTITAGVSQLKFQSNQGQCLSIYHRKKKSLSIYQVFFFLEFIKCTRRVLYHGLPQKPSRPNNKNWALNQVLVTDPPSCDGHSASRQVD